jgi:hypothetical protein
LAIAGFTATERSEAEALKRQGWRLALEISAHESGAAKVSLIALSSDGVRRKIGHVKERTKKDVN